MRQMLMVNIDGLMNSKGITNLTNINEATLTIGSSSIPYELIDNKIEFYDIPYRVSKDNQYDNIYCDGQIVDLDCNIDKIYMLGVSCQGDYFEEVEICFEDDTRVIKMCNFTDFLSVEPYFDDKIATRFSYSHTSAGIVDDLKIALWIDEIEIDVDKKVKFIKLPENLFMHIFAITVSNR